MADIRYVSLTEDGTEERWYLDDSMYRRYYLGSLAEERPFNASDATFRVVIRALDNMESGDTLTKLRNALNTNRAYLDKVNGGTVTNADHLAQVAALTKQMTGVLSRTVLQVAR